MLPKYLVYNWSICKDGLVLFVAQGKVVLDARELSHESDSLFVLDRYESNVEPQVSNLSFLTPKYFDVSNYTLSKTEYFATRESMHVRMLEIMSNENHF
jgi:hypothetical protein